MGRIKRFITICVLLVVFLVTCNVIYATGFYTIEVARKLIAFGITTVFSSTYDTATPAGTDDPSEADDRMREIKAAIQERLNVDHVWALTGTEVSATDTGEHRKITFNVTIADPTQVASKAHLYMKNDELYYQDDTNTTKQITNAGALNVEVAEILGILTNNVSFTAIDNAGTGTVDLIRATGTDRVQIGHSAANPAELATNDPPDGSAGIANKLYVDTVHTSAGTMQASGATVFNTTMAAATTFEDLNLSAQVGSNIALVFLEVQCSAGDVYIAKPKGEGTATFADHWPGQDSAGYGSSNIDFEGTNNFAYVIVATDASGVISHGAETNTSTFTIKLIGFIR